MSRYVTRHDQGVGTLEMSALGEPSHPRGDSTVRGGGVPARISPETGMAVRLLQADPQRPLHASSLPQAAEALSKGRAPS